MRGRDDAATRVGVLPFGAQRRAETAILSSAGTRPGREHVRDDVDAVGGTCWSRRPDRPTASGATSGHTAGTMSRRVPAMLLVLAVVAACVPAQAVEPPRASMPTATSTEVAPAPSSVPTVGPPLEPPPPTASPTPGETATSPDAASASPGSAAEPEPFSVNLAQVADFVPQYTSNWCVGASLQMARSIITGERIESRRSQRLLWRMARDRSLESPYGGANPAGWTAALNDLGLGPYRLVSRPTFQAAVSTAARALATTGRPVGLVMWAGRHAWVMTGFDSMGDPRTYGDATVGGVRVMDPLYPGKTLWGRSPAPNRLVDLETLARQFVMRDRPDYDFGVAPGWLLVLPTD